ncbi:hypothetical protein EVJ58_g5040 [Rhodofomes roseus]|uniref:Uncharacterized protein n=1 Tax=Rhodofomes roseus TaxID=34475 RepID=A0A4Y9YFZ5_9APHY|nr:hypothetical protein EVJ58_g5040 [Rhodofomes roseus]
MSQPPPYSSRPYSENQPPENPDRRPLPPGWISQWDSNYNAWLATRRPQARHRRTTAGTAQDTRAPSGAQRYDDYRGPSPGYGGQPPSNYGPGPGYGAPARDSRGWFGSSAASAQQPAMIQQAAPKKSGIGMGTALAAGGAGLLGGVILEDLWQNHDEHEREEGYDDAMQDGYGGGGFDGPQDDFGGGGGDFF